MRSRLTDIIPWKEMIFLVLDKLFKREKPPEPIATPQTMRLASHPFSAIERYSPLSKPEFALYDAIREAVPVVDAAISKIIALTGGFKVECREKAAQKSLEDFLKNVRVGHSSFGIETFLAQYTDQLLMYGTAVGEIVPTTNGEAIAALYNAPLDAIEIEKSQRGLGTVLFVRKGGEKVPVSRPAYILLSALNPKPDEICGRSLLSSMPFMTGILLKIFNSVGNNFDRVGNVRFSVVYRPGNDSGERAYSKERAMQIANEWSRAMRNSADGRISDFVAVGDVEIKAIGADNQILDCDVPVRHVLEQIVAKTGLPPFMLGLSWSTTECMSSQQADILTSELNAYRRLLEPVIMKICKTHLLLNGFDGNCNIVWNNISLQDEVELAKAALYRAQTAKLLDGKASEQTDLEVKG